MESVIRADGLRKRYGNTVAVDDVSFEVGRGEIFGVVGPNGAGKTTTVECLTGMRKPDSGTVEVLGLDPSRHGDELRRRIGIQLQQAALPERLKVREALELYSSFYEKPADWKRLMSDWDLTDKQNAYFANLSGGQKQRLFVVLALLNDPEVVFLDELTTGLDPQARRTSWELVRGIREAGKTVVLVTHFMDEAEQLCDRVAVVDGGKVIALDSPVKLISDLAAETRLTFTVGNGFDPSCLKGVRGVTGATRDGERVVVTGGSILAPVAAELERRGVDAGDLKTDRASLEDVFISLTRRRVRD
ncbi:MAG: ABC transporter ATP-binding protein [Rubrobacter sp.]